ncbi:hypothetical protein LINGRAHAP2_LOCUS31241 [Linum grandiflorum]
MSPAKYLNFPYDAQQSHMLRLHGQLFNLQTRTVGTGGKHPAKFVVTSFWDLIAAFY